MKIIKIVGISAIVVLALSILGITLVFAQKPAPTVTPWINTMRNMMQGSGYASSGTSGNFGGMMDGSAQSMQAMHDQMTQNGGMDAMHEWMHQQGGVHDTVFKALADKLGLTTDELTTQLQSGKTLAQIAKDQSVSTQDLAALMETTMKSALAQAVKDGKLTQEQADAITSHMNGQYEWMINNIGAGMMNGSGGMMNGNGNGGMMGPGSDSGGCHDNDDSADGKSSL